MNDEEKRDIIAQWMAEYVEDHHLLEVDLVEEFIDTIFQDRTLVAKLWPGRKCVHQNERYCYIRSGSRRPGPNWKIHPDSPDIWYRHFDVQLEVPRLDMCEPITRAKSARSMGV